ncbi:complement receptor type 1 isoform X2 [Ornithorhynchus anatinus]|uniref:complement receptor type 1 isoform X2 n=1 Tax=Ornithorhynchus anatinus TaxID=9258 RepID=UPI0019D4DB21|nr:complement receptor type 1 isoform X2 [Ornithorhynchus anatinus]
MSPAAPRLPLLLFPLLLLLLPAAHGDCPDPPEIPNAHPLLPDPPQFPTDTSITYSCNKGFVKIPDKSNSVVCLENNQWSESTEFCNRSCDVPPTFRFASLKPEYRTQNYFPVGSVVEYECRPGYKRNFSRSSNLTCLENLVWSKEPEFCIRKQCPSPPDLPNGQVHITDILFGSVIHFSCNAGYKLIGDHSSTCELVDNKLAWSNSHPECAPILCPSPPNIANGLWQPNENDEYPVGASVPYTCDRGFSLVGNKDLVCGSDGTWNSPPPECKVVSCENPVVENGIPVNPSRPPYSYKATLIFSCKSGFTLEGSAKITCESNSTWTPDPPKCLKMAILCPPPPNITHGTWQRNRSEEFVPGALVSYTCEKGFSLIGNRDLVCGDVGSWSGPPPECKAILCPPPPNIVHGTWQRKKSEEFVPGASVSYTCEKGFSLIGNRDLVCEDVGSWSGPPPGCKGFCENPEVKNGRVVESSQSPPYLYQTTLQFRCNPGFTMEGNPNIKCESNGTWIPPPPVCHSASTISSGVGGVIAVGVLGIVIVAAVLAKYCYDSGKSGSYNTYENNKACNVIAVPDDSTEEIWA